MKFRLALAAFLTFAVATVSADIPLRPSHANLLLGPTAGGGGSSYTGVGDIVSGMYIWGGVQALSGAYASAHGNLYVLTKVSGGETCNIPSLSTGLPGLTAGCSAGSNGQTAASFCSSSSATCHIAFYDQSGAGNNFTSVAAANWPYWDVSTGCVYFSAANLYMQTVSNVSALSQPLTFYLVAESITGSGGAVITNAGGPQWSTTGTANTWQFYQGGGA